jgi:hypothetical protein
VGWLLPGSGRQGLCGLPHDGEDELRHGRCASPYALKVVVPGTGPLDRSRSVLAKQVPGTETLEECDQMMGFHLGQTGTDLEVITETLAGHVGRSEVAEDAVGERELGV